MIGTEIGLATAGTPHRVSLGASGSSWDERPTGHLASDERFGKVAYRDHTDRNSHKKRALRRSRA